MSHLVLALSRCLASTVAVQTVLPVPTLSEWGLLILPAMLALLTGGHLRRKDTPAE